MSETGADSAPALRCALAAAIAAGVAGDCYLLWGQTSATALALPALAVPLLTALMLCGLSGAALLALRPLDRGAAVFASLMALLAITIAVLGLLPPIARDELTHHLAIPALYVRTGRIIEVPFAEQAYYPMLIEMYYTPLLQWLPDNVPKYLHLLYGLGSAAWVMLYLRRRHGADVAALGGLIFFSTPVVASLSASAYVDLGLLFYATGALVALLLWAEDQRSSWLVAAALMAGFAGATKYNGLLVIVLLAAGTVLLPPADVSGARRLGYAMAFASLALLPVLPWLVKNFLQTGNPIFPLFNGVLGGRPLPAHRSIDILTRRQLLYGESWLDIALIPIRIFVTGRDNDPARFDGVFSPLLLLGFGAALARHASRRDHLLACYAGAYALLAFFLITLRVRYSIVIVAPLVLLTCEQVAQLWRAGGVGAALTNVAVAASLLFSAGHVALLWHDLDPLAYLTGRLDRDAYVERFVPEYAALRFANQHLPDSARVYLLFLGNRSYYIDRPFIYDTYYSGTTLERNVAESTDGAGVAARLHADGVTHLLSADLLLDRFLRDSLSDEQLQRWQDFAAHHLERLYGGGGFGLYAVRGD